MPDEIEQGSADSLPADRQIPKICLTYLEAAWSLGIGVRNLRTMVSRGQVPVVELGGKVLFDPSDLQELKQKHKTVRNKPGEEV